MARKKLDRNDNDDGGKLIKVSGAPSRSTELVAQQRGQVAEVLEEEIPLAERLAPYRELFDHESKLERAMFHAMNHLCDKLEGDPELWQLWQDAWNFMKKVHGVEKDQFTNVSPDAMTIGFLTAGNRNNLEHWRNAAQTYLEEALLRSTFAHLGSSMNVESCLRAAKLQKKTVPLHELARHFRSAIISKEWLGNCKAILEEREIRLRAKFQLTDYEPITMNHRVECPYFAYITLEQMTAYMAGDRSDFVFSIEEPIEGDAVPANHIERLP